MTSKIQVNSIEGFDPVGPVELTYGVIVPPGQPIVAPQGLNIVGIVSASSFFGNGSGLTNISVANTSKVIAFSIIT